MNRNAARSQTNSTAKGRWGEDRAAVFLRSHGYRIVQRNMRCTGGEIDIVCFDGRTLVFVEVKTRHSNRFGSALGAVDRRKRKALQRVAADYAQILAPGVAFRFDVLTIDKYRIRLYRNAF